MMLTDSQKLQALLDGACGAVHLPRLEIVEMDDDAFFVANRWSVVNDDGARWSINQLNGMATSSWITDVPNLPAAACWLVAEMLKDYIESVIWEMRNEVSQEIGVVDWERGEPQ